MSTALKEPTAFLVTPPVMPVSGEGRQLSIAASPVASREQLRAAVALISRGESALDRMTRDKGTSPRTGLQRGYTWIERHPRLCGNVAVGSLYTGIVAAILGGLFVGLTNDSWLTGASAAAGAVLTGAMPMLALLGIESAALREKKAALTRTVSLSDVQPMLDEHEKASGCAKLVIGRELKRWHDSMNASKMLGPEARLALREAMATSSSASPGDADMADVLTTLVHTIRGSGVLSEADVGMLKKTIERAPAEARVELAIAAQALVKESKRPVDYEASHQLFALRESVAP